MKIYTYHQHVPGMGQQKEMIELWKTNWSKKGFEPIVLGIDDALSAPIHDEYMNFVHEIHNTIDPDVNIEDTYWLATQREIAAFTVIDEPSFVSDYDVFNVNFNIPSEVEDCVHWRDARCTCFASGGSNGWNNYINWLFSMKDKIIEGCQRELVATGRNKFTDQDFLVYANELTNISTPIDNIPFLLYRDENSPVDVCDDHLDNIIDVNTIHFSHGGSNLKVTKVKEVFDTIELKRIFLIKKILKL